MKSFAKWSAGAAAILAIAYAGSGGEIGLFAGLTLTLTPIALMFTLGERRGSDNRY